MTKINVHQVQSGDVVRIHPAIDAVAESGLATVLRRLITARGVKLVVRWNPLGSNERFRLPRVRDVKVSFKNGRRREALRPWSEKRWTRQRK